MGSAAGGGRGGGRAWVEAEPLGQDLSPPVQPAFEDGGTGAGSTGGLVVRDGGSPVTAVEAGFEGFAAVAVPVGAGTGAGGLATTLSVEVVGCWPAAAWASSEDTDTPGSGAETTVACGRVAK
jgi:hypothetical protein